MADKKITELPNINGADLVDADEFVVVDISADETKAITLAELKNAFDAGTGFVRVTGDTMTGALDVQSTITADGLTVGDGTGAESIRIDKGASSAASLDFYSGGVASGKIEYTSFEWLVTSSVGPTYFKTNSTDRMQVASNGDISFYEDTGNTPKMVWSAAGESLEITQSVNGESDPIRVSNKDVTAGTAQNVGYDFGLSRNSGAFKTQAGRIEVGRSEDWTASDTNIDAYMSFATYNNNALATHMTIDSSGNVGIGITPTKKLTVFGTGAGNATVQIEGEGGADPYINFLTNNTQHWSMGVDDSDSDKFKLSEHSALGANDYLTVDVTGNVTMPSQPAFNVNKGSTNQDNIAVGGETTVTWSTEVYDIGANFASNTFTAPVTGKYQMNVWLRLASLDSAVDYYIFSIASSNRQYRFLFDPDFGQDQAYWSVNMSALVDMDASDTAIITAHQNTGTAQTDISGDPPYTFWQGYLVA